MFRHPDAPKDQATALINAATANGGQTLDAFDTTLPHLYSRAGLRAVARPPFNPQFAPEGWDYQLYSKYNNGQLDVIFNGSRSELRHEIFAIRWRRGTRL